MKKQFWGCVFLTVLLIFSCFGCGRRGETPSEPPESPSGTETPSESSSEPGETSSEPYATLPESEPEVTEPEATLPRIPDGFTETDETLYTTNGLNLRAAPSTDADILTVIPSASPVHRIAVGDGWSYVEFQTYTAYVSSDYLSPVLPTLSNESRNFGYNRYGERKGDNIPVDIFWYENNWSAYADFMQDPDQKIIYLTMDEGYENGNTPSILDTLKEKGVTAVFFLTEAFVDECPDLVQRMIDEGHILGNHTCSHPSAGMPSLSDEEQREDIMRLHNKVLDQFGYEMKLFRYPAGIFSERSLQLVDSLGYHSVFWSFAYRDFDPNNQPDPTEALKMCMDELHSGAIYLLHALSDTNAQILGDWIDAVRARGYEYGVYPVE